MERDRVRGSEVVRERERERTGNCERDWLIDEEYCLGKKEDNNTLKGTVVSVRRSCAESTPSTIVHDPLPQVVCLCTAHCPVYIHPPRG